MSNEKFRESLYFDAKMDENMVKITIAMQAKHRWKFDIQTIAKTKIMVCAQNYLGGFG